MKENDIYWSNKTFQELDLKELYAILQLRSEIFVVEQNCVFQDMDDLDSVAHHVMAWSSGGVLVAYTRYFENLDGFQSIGRVVVKKTHRQIKLGELLMEKTISFLQTAYSQQPIKIGAQLYLERFYEKFGFKRASEVYLEDGIPHIKMISLF